MSIPEPEFKINVYQLENMLDELGYDRELISNDRVEHIHKLRDKCFEHLDTIEPQQ